MVAGSAGKHYQELKFVPLNLEECSTSLKLRSCSCCGPFWGDEGIHKYLTNCPSCQAIDMARIFLRHSSSMRRMEGGLHHLSPLTGVVNTMGARSGISPISERELLFTLWTILEVRCGKAGAG